MIDFVKLFAQTFNDDCRRYINTPFRWSGNNYIAELQRKLEGYQLISSKFFSVLRVLDKDNRYIKYGANVNKICKGLIECLKEYFKGLPQVAYNKFDEMIKFNFDDKVDFFNFSFFWLGRENLYRAVAVDDNKKYGRDRCFHVPYNMREKVSTNRFSIPGHPTLYLSDSIRLCSEEISSLNDKLISKFHVDNTKGDFGPKMKVVDLSIQLEELIQILKVLPNDDLKMKFIIGYLLRMPIQIACSFMRINRNSSFAVEYVIPQLLMQWIKMHNDETTIVGVKYKSCYNKKCSSLGNNYAFPSSGIESVDDFFCPILSKGFLLTKPINFNDYPSLDDMEEALDTLELANVNV